MGSEPDSVLRRFRGTKRDNDRHQGLVGFVVATSVILVFLLGGAAIAIGRSTTQSQPITESPTLLPPATTTYPTPTPTGERYEPSPIATGVSQISPSGTQSETQPVESPSTESDVLFDTAGGYWYYEEDGVRYWYDEEDDTWYVDEG